jgi:simple sugar transport system ATP-binding protein
MKVLFGMLAPNSGQVYYHGRQVNFQNPGQAIANGIGMVHQEILLVSEYTVWQNVILGIETTNKFGKIDEKEAIEQVRQQIDEYHFNLEPQALVGEISMAARQKVEILKLLYRNVSVLILDEPTSVLTPQEIPQLFEELRSLRNDGHTILFISHHLDEVLSLSDRITVLCRGKKVGTVQEGETSKSELAKMMVGRNVVFSSIKSETHQGRKIFELKDWTSIDTDGRTRLNSVNVNVSSGEIVGIAGVEGNGQHELVNSIMGLYSPSEGSLIVEGVDLTNAPILKRRKKISFVSQDRGNMSSCLDAPISENVLMTHHRLNKRFAKFGGWVLNYNEAELLTKEVQEQFAVHMDTSDAEFKSLSGGNQQKVILGRELLLNAPFILLDQPTRGLDVVSIEYVHRQILAMREQGRAILMLSADLEELFRITDRILVLNRGEIVANLRTDETSIEEVGYLMLEGKHHEAKTD